MNKKMTLIAACFAALLTFGACGEDHDHDDHDHDHKSGSKHDHDDHSDHDHNYDKMDKLGTATIAGLEVTVLQEGHVDAGEAADIHVKLPAKADAVVRVSFAKEDGKPIGAPMKAAAHGNVMHASLIAPESLDGVLVWVEVESGEGDAKKSEKKSFAPHKD